MKNIILLLTIVFCTVTNAQNFSKGTLSLASDELVEGRLSIDNTTEKVLVKNGLTTRPYSFAQIKSVQIGKENYQKISINNKNYLAHSLNAAGSKAALYKISTNTYLVSNGNTARSFNTKTDQNQIPGILSILFNDCNDLRAQIINEDSFNQGNLVTITQLYNNCSYAPYAPTEKEIARADKHNTDKASFYVGAGANLNSISFFDQDETEGLVGAGLKLGVIASPSFLGNLQGNLFAFIEGSANFAGDKDFSNNADPVNFSVNSFRVQLGLEYLFNKTGNVKPIIGIGFGATSDAFSGSIAGNSFDIDGGNPFIAPRLGARFKLKNEKHIGLMIEYITSYENDLTFPTQEAIIPLEVGSQNIGISINYYF